MNSNSILNNFLYFLFVSVVFVIYLPIIVMIIFSFNSSKYQIMPFRNFTTEWYQRVLNDSQYLDGLLNSLMVSVTVSLLATTLAFFCSYSLVNSNFKGKSLLLSIPILDASKINLYIYFYIFCLIFYLNLLKRV